MKRFLPGMTKGKLMLAACWMFAAVTSAHAGLIINATFDSTITSDVNAATIEAGINAAIARAEAAISNNTTVSILFKETASGLGGSLTSHYIVPYSTYRTLLATSQTLSANDNTALASLPISGVNPVNGNANVNVQTALARTLGYANFGGSDGTISLNTSIMNISRTGTQNGSFYDLQAVAAHEIDEVLGVGGPGSALPTTGSSVGVLDLFRYSAAGTRSFSTSTSPSYFSINGGVTNLVNFNQTGSGDYADWASSATHRVQDAFGTPGAQLDIGTAELTALDVIGYDLVAVPEPGTALFGLALCGVSVLRRRRNIPLTPRRPSGF
ncbi:MAG: NF038122 family metalloprotease [Verrucomicrobiota bacterium]